MVPVLAIGEHQHERGLMKLVETQQLYSGVVLLQYRRERLEEPFGSHSIGKDRYHEISAHLVWHQQRQHS